MKYVLGIDLGTSGTKTVLFDVDGTIVASESAEYQMMQPHNGWAEQDPEDWWQAAVFTLSSVMKKSGVDKDDVVGLGISGQMHGLVMLDEKGDVLRPSIIWCDQRTGAECIEITKKVGAKQLIDITANPALTGFTASKIMWVKNHEPDIYKKCKHILLPKDYVRYKLTGDFATEVSDASGMQLLDVPKRQWSHTVLDALEIDVALLGTVHESQEITGTISHAAAALTGLSTHTVVVGGAGDNAASAVGTGVVVDKKAFTTIGTSGVVYAHTKNLAIDPLGRVHTFCAAVPNEWHVMGVTQGAGLSLKWFRDNFCRQEKDTAEGMHVSAYDLMNKQAEQIPIGCDSLLYLPYLMGERTPHLDPDCRGVFFGLSNIHTRQHMLRAVMEGVTYSLMDCTGVLRSMGVEFEEMLACGGGGRSDFWRQMLADVYRLPVKTVAAKESAAMGVAILAGVGAGVYRSVQDACRVLIQTNTTQQPNVENASAYEKFYAIYQKLYPQLKDIYKQL